MLERWYGGRRRFESVRGLCKSAGNRRLRDQTRLQSEQGAVGMGPFMDSDAREGPGLPQAAPAVSSPREGGRASRGLSADTHGESLERGRICASVEKERMNSFPMLDFR